MHPKYMLDSDKVIDLIDFINLLLDEINTNDPRAVKFKRSPRYLSLYKRVVDILADWATQKGVCK